MCVQAWTSEMPQNLKEVGGKSSVKTLIKESSLDFHLENFLGSSPKVGDDIRLESILIICLLIGVEAGRLLAAHRISPWNGNQPHVMVMSHFLEKSASTTLPSTEISVLLLSSFFRSRDLYLILFQVYMVVY